MLERISVGELAQGMYVHAFCAKWMDHPFLRSGFVLRGPEDLKKIQASGMAELWIDTDKGVGRSAGAELPAAPAEPAEPAAAATLPAAPPPAGPVAASRSNDARRSHAQALQDAVKLCRNSVPKLTLLFGEARMGKAIDTAMCTALVDEIAEFVHRSPNALLAVARLKRHDEYTYLHCVSVSALMTALGLRLGLKGAELRAVGMGGLLHDIGKALVPLEILNKPGKLTATEFAAMQRHSELGHSLLQKVEDLDPIALDVCLRHHEKLDGTGYPGSVPGAQVSLHAKMGTVCDVYDALTSDRSYRPGCNPAVALRRMAGWHGHIDGAVFRSFVATVGIYPIGSLVRLKSGRLAVVTEQNPASLLTPLVKAFYSTRSEQHIEPRLIDLGDPLCQDEVQCCEDLQHWNFKQLDRLWGGENCEPV